MRYYLLDRVTELTPGRSARGVKCVTLTDEILHDHFPGFPMLPGALIVEAAAQLGGFLVEMTVNTPGGDVRRAVLVQIQRAKFHEPVRPGDRLDIQAAIDGMQEAAAQVEFTASVDGKDVARGTLTFMLRAIDVPEVHAQRRQVYALWTRDFSPPLVLP